MVASPDGASLTPRSHPPPREYIYVCYVGHVTIFPRLDQKNTLCGKNIFSGLGVEKKFFRIKCFSGLGVFFFPVIFFFCLRNVRKNAKKHSVALFFLFLSLLITILKCSKTFPMLSRSEKVNLGNITSSRPSASSWQTFPLIHFF